VPDDSWSSWTWQLQNRVEGLSAVSELFDLSEGEREAFEACSAAFRVSMTPYYASLVDRNDPRCPIRAQAIAGPAELSTAAHELPDPLAEERYSPVPGLTHRYSDRALLYVTHNCPVYCRHCTRRRKVSDPSSALSRSQMEVALDYLAAATSVRDVLISGGDPLSLSDERLDELLGRVLAIDHVEMVRIGTRNPVTLPMRITEGLGEMLARHRPVYVVTHFNHPRECTDEAARALAILADAGCVLSNQTVLLGGVNDAAQPLAELSRWLLANRCRPYALHQCDMVAGISHFRVPLSAGIRLVEQLRTMVSGLGVPHFVVDLPDGGGKINMGPEHVAGRAAPWVLLRDGCGGIHRYFDPDPTHVTGPDP
jgi:lysine 2,3-aminomutase